MQGNDDLGIGKAKITYTELGEDGESSTPCSVEVAPNEVASFCAHLAGEGGCIDILVNGMSEYDYLKMVRGLPSECNIDDPHGYPYCHTHKCGATDPCIVRGCPHCTGEQRVVYGRQDQGNDSLGLGKPDPTVVGGKHLPFIDPLMAEEGLPICCQCSKRVGWLASDNRCKDCTSRKSEYDAALKDYDDAMKAFEHGG